MKKEKVRRKQKKKKKEIAIMQKLGHSRHSHWKVSAEKISYWILTLKPHKIFLLFKKIVVDTINGERARNAYIERLQMSSKH